MANPLSSFPCTSSLMQARKRGTSDEQQCKLQNLCLAASSSQEDLKAPKKDLKMPPSPILHTSYRGYHCRALDHDLVLKHAAKTRSKKNLLLITKYYPNAWKTTQGTYCLESRESQLSVLTIPPSNFHRHSVQPWIGPSFNRFLLKRVQVTLRCPALLTAKLFSKRKCRALVCARLTATAQRRRRTFVKPSIST